MLRFLADAVDALGWLLWCQIAFVACLLTLVVLLAFQAVIAYGIALAAREVARAFVRRLKVRP